MLSRREFAGVVIGSAGQPVFRSRANLVVVRFSVMKGRSFVTDLTAEDVIVAEDGREQKISLFESPLSAWQQMQEIDFRILVDLSGTAARYRSLTGDLLIRALLGVHGRFAAVSIYGFAYDCMKLAGPSRDVAELNEGIRRLDTVDVKQLRRSASRIFDSVVQVARDAGLDAQRTHPVLVIFSDGLNSGNRMSLDDAVRAALNSGMTVYPVLLAVPGERDEREAALIEHYGKMGEATGGRSFWPASFTEEHLSRILNHVAAQVKSEYAVGYYRAPERKGPGTVRVNLKDRRAGDLKGGVRRVSE